MLERTKRKELRICYFSSKLETALGAGPSNRLRLQSKCPGSANTVNKYRYRQQMQWRNSMYNKLFFSTEREEDIFNVYVP